MMSTTMLPWVNLSFFHAKLRSSSTLSLIKVLYTMSLVECPSPGPQEVSSETDINLTQGTPWSCRSTSLRPTSFLILQCVVPYRQLHRTHRSVGSPFRHGCWGQYSSARLANAQRWLVSPIQRRPWRRNSVLQEVRGYPLVRIASGDELGLVLSGEAFMVCPPSWSMMCR